MFGWFYKFLYSISATLFMLIDGLTLCANKLCGIEPINFDGEKTDFLSYLLFSDEIGFAFRASALLATILLVIFTIFMILRSIVKDKAEGTPVQLAVKSFKTLLTFFFVPLCMLAFVLIGNAFVKALYGATMQAASTPGSFLFSVFAQEGGMDAAIANQFKSGVLDYTDTGMVSKYMDIESFPFIFSWLTGAVVLFGIGSAMLIFVDRVFSIVILYIVAPLSISSSVLDDGARFKLWRDQFLSKFIMGYGMIIAINIYALVCGLVMRSDFAFFADSAFLNLIMKLLVMGGGAMTMQKSMAIIGNLVSQGAGSNELRDNALSMGSLARMATGLAGKALYVPSLPFRAAKSILGDAIAQQSRHLGAKLLRGVGLEGGLAKKTDKDGVEDPGSKSDSQNNDKANYNSNGKSKDAIEGGFKPSFSGGDNANNDQGKNDKGGKNPVSNAIENGGGKGGGGGDNTANMMSNVGGAK